VDFKRIGSSLIGITVLIALISIVGNAILGGAVANNQQPGSTIALVLRLLAYASVEAMVICAVMTAFVEHQISKAILPAIFGIAGILLLVASSQFAFSAMAAAYMSSVTVFGGEKTEPVWQKNTIMLFGLIGVVAFNIGLAGTVSSLNTVSMIGVLLGVPAFLLALVYPIQRQQWGWVALLLIVAATGPIFLVLAHRPDVGLPFLPMTAIAAVRGMVWNDAATERHTFGTMSLLGVIMIIGGGTLINSVFSTVPNQPGAIFPLQSNTFYAGVDMYVASGILALMAWIFSVVYAGRHSMWGWFATSLLLPGVGALMLGFFGPTPQDYQQGKASAAAKRAAGA
jgi:hypothetical protein